MKQLKPCAVCRGRLFVNGKCIACVKEVRLTAEQSALFNKPIKALTT